MQRRISVFSVAILSGLLFAFTNWSLMLQSDFSSVSVEASKQSLHDETRLHHVTNQKQNNSSNPINSSSITAGVSSQRSPNPSLSLSSDSKNELNQNQPGYAQLTGPIPYVLWSVPTTAKVVFITVDDGWYPSESVLAVMREQHVPISAFLIGKAVQERPDFWRAFLAVGGDIDNHTFTHPDLTKESLEEIVSQIETAQKYLNTFSTPSLFRPPYGSYNQTVCQAASQAGIKHVVIWNATMDSNGLQTYNGKPLEPGSIILLHWVPDLAAQLEKLIVILNQEHLGVASLHYALNHPDNFPIAWPLAQAAY
jgi:Predicted xylanase/chitin deacetylase